MACQDSNDNLQPLSYDSNVSFPVLKVVYLQVPVILHPSAWWRHAIGAVLSERRDLLRQEAAPKLSATQQWRLQRQYIAAYSQLQMGQQSAAHRFGWKPWRELDMLKVWPVASIPYLPGDLLIHLLRMAGLAYIKGLRHFEGLMARPEAWRLKQRCKVRHIDALKYLCDIAASCLEPAQGTCSHEAFYVAHLYRKILQQRGESVKYANLYTALLEHFPFAFLCLQIKA